MNNPKVYMLIRWDYNGPLHYYDVWGVYTTAEKAEAARVEKAAEKQNIPYEEDGYGPLQGYKFSVWEREIDS